jgi:NAD(P)H dehydrogenase (quinone)
VVFGDLLDFDSVRSALKGVQRAYFVCPIRPGLLQATARFAYAAKEAGVGFIVNMSQKSARQDSKSQAALEHWLGERLFDWSGVPVAHLRPTYFAEWFFYLAELIRQGRMPVPFGTTSRHAPVASEDQAGVIDRILDNPAPHAGKTYPLFGPVELTHPEIAAIIGRVLGKEVKYEQVTSEKFVELVWKKPDPYLVQHLHEVGIDHHDGIFVGTNNLIQEIGGRQPMTVEQFVIKHRDAFL